MREAQVSRLERLKRSRDPGAVQSALQALGAIAHGSPGNILDAAVAAARARATVGEISDVLRRAFGEHDATSEVVGDIYGAAYADDPEYRMLCDRLADAAATAGHKPRILLAKLGQDGHDRGAKIIASAFSDLGFDVTVGPLFQTPDEAAKLAIERGVQMIGVSSLAAGHRTLLPQLVEALRARNASDVIVVCGGVIPRQDYDFLRAHGVAAVFGPGTNVLEAARHTLDLLEGRRRNA